MSRKPKKGYFVRGRFVAEGSELDEQLKAELRGDGPSKTELKAQSAELQALGEQLQNLRADLLAPLDLPSRLQDALQELARISNFEGQRRQRQYIGKLMRQLDEAQVQAIRTALQVQRKGAAADAMLLHAAENWRDRLLAEDAALGAWAAQFPAADVQQLRSLIRQARKDAAAQTATQGTPPPGQAPRQGRAYRELFQLLRQSLAEDQAPAEAQAAPDNPTPDTEPTA